MAVPITPFLYELPGHSFQVRNASLDCLLATLYDRVNAYVCYPALALTMNDQPTSTVVDVAGGRFFSGLRRIRQILLGSPPVSPEGSGFCLIPSPDYPKSRDYTLECARYLDRNGDTFGAARKYVQQKLFMRN